MATLDRVLAYPRTHWPLGLMLVLLFALRQLVCGHRAGPEDCDRGDIDDVQQHEHQPGNQCAGEQVTNGNRLGRENAHLELRLLVRRGHDVAEHHEDDRWRDDLPERAGGADRAGRDLRRVAAPQHRGQ